MKELFLGESGVTGLALIQFATAVAISIRIAHISTISREDLISQVLNRV